MTKIENLLNFITFYVFTLDKYREITYNYHVVVA